MRLFDLTTKQQQCNKNSVFFCFQQKNGKIVQVLRIQDQNFCFISKPQSNIRS